MVGRFGGQVSGKEKEMRTLIIVMVVALISWFAGFLIGRMSVDTFVETKTKIVYSLPAGTSLGELCQSFVGEKKMKDLNEWKEGYREGYKAR